MDSHTLFKLTRNLTKPLWDKAIKHGLCPIILKTDLLTGEGKNPIHKDTDRLAFYEKNKLSYKGTYYHNNIAIECGAKSGLVVIDIDVKNRGLNEWKKILLDGNYESIEDFCERWEGPIIKSPSGGYHIYLKYEEADSELYKSPHKSIDFQANKKLIVFGGSVYMSCYPNNNENPKPHKCNPEITNCDDCLWRGRKYEWIKDISSYEIPKMAEWMRPHFIEKPRSEVIKAIERVNQYTVVSSQDFDTIIPHLAPLSYSRDNWIKTCYCLQSLGSTLEQVLTFAKLAGDGYDEKATIALYNEGSKIKHNVGFLRKLCKECDMDMKVYQSIFCNLENNVTKQLLYKGDMGLGKLFLLNLHNEIIITDVDKSEGYFWNASELLWKKSSSTSFKNYVGTILCPVIEKYIREYDATITKEIDELDNETRKKELTRQAEVERKRLYAIKQYVCNTTPQKNIFKQASPSLFIENYEDIFNAVKDHLPISDGQLVNLRTGEIRKRTQSDYWTFSCNVSYLPNSDFTEAKEFLYALTRKHKSSDNREDYFKFMIKVLGYTLTGEVSDQSFFILNGCGSNGKSSLTNIMNQILTDNLYKVADESIIQKGDSHSRAGRASPEKITLRGSRLAVISEPEDSKGLSNTSIKNLTGEEKITARGLFKESVQFMPTFKFFVLCNKRPELKVEQAMLRRIKYLPFDNLFEKTEQSKRKIESLIQRNINAFFTLFVGGAIEWYKDGMLTMPPCCVEAQEEMVFELDTIAQFLANGKVTLDPAGTIRSNHLYNLYVDYCGRTIKSVSDKDFSQLLQEKKFSKKRSNKGMVWVGIREQTEEEINQEESDIEYVDEKEPTVSRIEPIILEVESIAPISVCCIGKQCNGSCVSPCPKGHKDGWSFSMIFDGYKQCCSYCHLEWDRDKYPYPQGVI